MDDPLQARAYAEADFARTDQAFTERILALLAAPGTPDQAPTPGASGIVDLGCGPGNISFRLAAALPKANVVGLDGAAAMLALAERRRAADPKRWARLRFHQACLPLPAGALDDLPEPFAPPYSVVVSNSLLHHLHDPAVLWRTVRQLASPGALVVVRDLRRPADRETLAALVEQHAAGAPSVLRRDFGHSLAAAFRPEEVEEQLERAGLACLRVEALEDRYLEISGRLGDWGGSSGPTTSIAVRCTTS